MSKPENLVYTQLQIIRYGLIILWMYTAGAKLTNLNLFRHELNLQHFPPAWPSLLPVLLPVAELIACALLILPKTLKGGLNFSFGLLLIFTFYVAFALSGGIGQRPCSCGGVLKILSWRGHLLFNFCFLSLNGYGLYLFKLKERRQKQ